MFFYFNFFRFLNNTTNVCLTQFRCAQTTDFKRLFMHVVIMTQSQSTSLNSNGNAVSLISNAYLQSRVTFQNAILHDFIYGGQASFRAANNYAHSLLLFSYVGGLAVRSKSYQNAEEKKNSALILREREKQNAHRFGQSIRSIGNVSIHVSSFD